MKYLLPIAFALSLAACSAEVTTDVNAAASEPITIEASTHNVKCGCSIEAIGDCGNYIEFDGEYAKLTNWNEMGLEEMAWCKQDGIKAEVAGTRTGDDFIATAITVAK